jgi:dGTPase
MAEPDVMPESGAPDGNPRPHQARVVCDYVAGHDDRYAIEEHRKLFQLDIWG